MKLTFDEIKQVYCDITDPGEQSVGYERTYEKMYQWLTDPPLKKGLGVSKGFATKLLAATAYQVRAGSLEFEKGYQLNQYLKEKANHFNERLLDEEEKTLQRVTSEEIGNIINDKWFYLKVKVKDRRDKKEAVDKKKMVKARLKKLKKAAKKAKK